MLVTLAFLVVGSGCTDDPDVTPRKGDGVTSSEECKAAGGRAIHGIGPARCCVAE